MRQAVTTHLPVEDAPIEWAVTADGVLYTAQIPIYPDGKIETGDIEKQADLTFQNLKKTVEAAGGSLTDVTQVLVYLTGKEHFVKMNEVYRRYFSKPYPNRATVIVAGLMVPGAVIEIVAYAHLNKKS
jgi:enamine deaminase RidA (YjgF/YER057c/UK114 family)